MASTLSATQLEQAWVGAGGPAQSAPTAAAIAQAESGANPGSVNPNDPSGGSFGLWQINGVHAPQRNPQSLVTGPLGNLITWAQAMLDPATNAAAAVSVSGNGTDFTPWTSYSYQVDSNGKLYYVGPGQGFYRNYLPTAQQAQSEGALSGTVQAPVDSLTSASSGGTTDAQTTGYSVGVGPFKLDLAPIGYFIIGVFGILIMGAGAILLFEAWTKSEAASITKKAVIG